MFSSSKGAPSDSLSDASESPLQMKSLTSKHLESSKQFHDGVKNFEPSPNNDYQSSRGSRKSRVTVSAPDCKSNKGNFVWCAHSLYLIFISRKQFIYVKTMDILVQYKAEVDNVNKQTSSFSKSKIFTFLLTAGNSAIRYEAQYRVA